MGTCLGGGSKERLPPSAQYYITWILLPVTGTVITQYPATPPPNPKHTCTHGGRHEHTHTHKHVRAHTHTTSPAPAQHFSAPDPLINPIAVREEDSQRNVWEKMSALEKTDNKPNKQSDRATRREGRGGVQRVGLFSSRLTSTLSLASDAGLIQSTGVVWGQVPTPANTPPPAPPTPTLLRLPRICCLLPALQQHRRCLSVNSSAQLLLAITAEGHTSEERLNSRKGNKYIKKEDQKKGSSLSLPLSFLCNCCLRAGWNPRTVQHKENWDTAT